MRAYAFFQLNVFVDLNDLSSRIQGYILRIFDPDLTFCVTCILEVKVQIGKCSILFYQELEVSYPCDIKMMLFHGPSV